MERNTQHLSPGVDAVDEKADVEMNAARSIDDSDPASDESLIAAIEKQKSLEKDHDIKQRNCSWPKTAALLFSEYICLAIMSFPWSYSILGLVPGIILTIAVAASVQYTSLVLWRYCLKYPDIRDVCDIGQRLFWNKKWAWYGTAVAFLLNNTFIQALHCLVGAKYLNTMTGHTLCTVTFSAIVAIVSFVCSVPRTFSALSHAATFSAVTMFLSVLLSLGFAGTEEHPQKWSTEVGDPIWTVVAQKNTTYVAGMSAFLNIAYTFIGQITIPSFIAEMENPRDFPKALWAVTIAEVVVFTLAGSIVYVYSGNQYMTAPAYGALGWHGDIGKKVAFSFALPTIIFLGVLYASVSARFIFNNLLQNSRHRYSHTVTGWSVWIGVLGITWVVAFIIAEVIPFFSDLLSLMSSLFDSFFGFIFWGVAWIRMKEARYGKVFWRRPGVTVWELIEFGLNVLLILIGFYFLTCGTYTTVQSIIDNYRANAYGGVFSCSDNGL